MSVNYKKLYAYLVREIDRVISIIGYNRYYTVSEDKRDSLLRTGDSGGMVHSF